METRSRAASTDSGVHKTTSDRDCPPHHDSGNLTSGSLPPATPSSGAERSSQHERLLPHGSFRPPQLAGDLPRRDLKEATMNKLVNAITITTALVAGGTLMSGRAEAVPLGAPDA